jgi:Integrase core domain
MAIDLETLPKEGYACEAYILSFQTRNLSDAPMTRCTVPGDRIHSDICGWITPIALGESRYILIFIDDATRMMYLFVIKMKTAKEVRECFLKFRNIFEQDGRRIKSIRTDGGGEYRKQMAELCTETGIHHEERAPYTPEQTESPNEPTEQFAKGYSPSSPKPSSRKSSGPKSPMPLHISKTAAPLQLSTE